MSISAKELAQKLNISAATVSMVLNRKPGISEKTRNLVLDAAREYGYDFSKKWDTAEEKGSILYVIYKKHGTVVADTPFFSQLTEGIEQACKGKGFELQITYFYENKDFYRKVMKVEDQNSFINHFRDIVSPLMEEDIREILGEKTDAEFYVNFFCDAVICAFGRWISQKEPMPPKEFVNMMKSCIKVVAITQERMENE